MCTNENEIQCSEYSYNSLHMCVWKLYITISKRGKEQKVIRIFFIKYKI